MPNRFGPAGTLSGPGRTPQVPVRSRWSSTRRPLSSGARPMSRRRWSGIPATARRVRARCRIACHLFLMSASMRQSFPVIADLVAVRDAAMADGGHVADIGDAAAAELPECRQRLHQRVVVGGKFGRVARVEFGGLVQLRVALARCI